MTNGGIEICQKNDGFDSNGVLDLIGKREKKYGFEQMVEYKFAKKNNVK